MIKNGIAYQSSNQCDIMDGQLGQCQYQSMRLFCLKNLVVEHYPHYPKVEGLSAATTTRTGWLQTLLIWIQTFSAKMYPLVSLYTSHQICFLSKLLSPVCFSSQLMYPPVYNEKFLSPVSLIPIATGVPGFEPTTLR
jgi:hypothetical protein